MSERITYDGDITKLDEIVLNGVDLHIEQLSTHQWMIIATRDGLRVHLHGNDLWMLEEVGTDSLTAVGQALILCKEWTDRRGRRHECHSVKPHKRHRCSCGKWRQVDDR